MTRLIQGEMRVVYAGGFQRRHDAIELRHVGYRTDAHTVHATSQNSVVPDEDVSVPAHAQFGRETFGIRGIGEGARLDEQGRVGDGIRGCRGAAAGATEGVPAAVATAAAIAAARVVGAAVRAA